MTTTELSLEERTARVREESSFIGPLLTEIEGTIVGQKEMVRRILVGLLADGHLLLEGVPGLAKTLAVKTVADSIKATFRRIQFTPDLLPADLTGTSGVRPEERLASPPSSGRSSRRSCSPTKSTAPPPRCRARSWNRCRSGR